VPAFLKLFGARTSGTQLCQREACPRYRENDFEKAHGAPFSWERFHRSKLQTKPESDKIGGISREAIYLHPHVHIFASLPGLNIHFSSGSQPSIMPNSNPNTLVLQKNA